MQTQGDFYFQQFFTEFYIDLSFILKDIKYNDSWSESEKEYIKTGSPSIGNHGFDILTSTIFSPFVPDPLRKIPARSDPGPHIQDMKSWIIQTRTNAFRSMVISASERQTGPEITSSGNNWYRFE